MFGDSGDELGDGSVSVESTVEIVVVGEDSVDSVVADEPLRMCDELVLRRFCWDREGGRDAEVATLGFRPA